MLVLQQNSLSFHCTAYKSDSPEGIEKNIYFFSGLISPKQMGGGWGVKNG